MKMTKGLAVTASATALLSAGMAGAHASEATPYVIGGQQESNPWIVQLNFNSTSSVGTFGCTGEQINSEWVLTAKHCVDDATNMRVFQSNDQTNPGEGIRADMMYASPAGDIGLVHLSKEAPLPSYAQLDFSYTPTEGDSANIYGYGLGANSQPTSTLRGASVNVIGNSTDAYGGIAAHIRGVDGASNHGDSGGPMIKNGKVVAVCSTGDQADPGANINAQSNYALLSQAGDWITTMTGVTADGSGSTTPPSSPETPADPAAPETPVTPAGDIDWFTPGNDWGSDWGNWDNGWGNWDNGWDDWNAPTGDTGWDDWNTPVEESAAPAAPAAPVETVADTYNPVWGNSPWASYDSWAAANASGKTITGSWTYSY